MVYAGKLFVAGASVKLEPDTAQADLHLPGPTSGQNPSLVAALNGGNS